MSQEPSGETPPPFDRPFESETVEQRVYGVVLGTREPTAAGDIAERADCDGKTARKYLSWFAELGIVTTHEGRPTTYQRNEAYFEWRRIDELATNNSPEALQRRVRELTTTIETYREAYGADDPRAVDALAVEQPVDTVYADLRDWETAIRDRRLCERAHQQLRGRSEPTPGRP